MRTVKFLSGIRLGETPKKLKTLQFIRLVNVMLALVFAATYFHSDGNYHILLVYIFADFSWKYWFSFTNSQNCLRIIEFANLQKKVKSAGPGASENQYQ